MDDIENETDLILLLQKIVQQQQEQFEQTAKLTEILSRNADQNRESHQAYLKSLDESKARDARYDQQQAAHERGAWKRVITSAVILGTLIGGAIILSHFL